MPQGRRRSALEAATTAALAGLPCYAIPAAAGDQYSRIKYSCERKGSRLDENDLWIAATAITLVATLVTLDVDFKNVDGLIIEDWTT